MAKTSSKRGPGRPSPKPKTEIAKSLEEIRARSGIDTLKEFHSRLVNEGGCDVSYSAARNYHYDTRDPPRKYLECVARVFGANLEWLYSRDGEPFKRTPLALTGTAAGTSHAEGEITDGAEAGEAFDATVAPGHTEIRAAGTIPMQILAAEVTSTRSQWRAVAPEPTVRPPRSDRELVRLVLGEDADRIPPAAASAFVNLWQNARQAMPDQGEGAEEALVGFLRDVAWMVSLAPRSWGFEGTHNYRRYSEYSIGMLNALSVLVAEPGRGQAAEEYKGSPLQRLREMMEREQPEPAE
jgi:hypothetical protein